MSPPAEASTPATSRKRGFAAIRRGPLSAALACLLGVVALVPASNARAGTYVISDCPSAPANNGDSGPWAVFGSPQDPKGTCSSGPGDWIGPQGGYMNPNTVDGVQVVAPDGSGITIRQARVWWYVPAEVSGATTFALASANTGVVEEAATPKNSSISPDVLTIPSNTTELTLADYCSSDDGPTGCTFGGGVNPNLQLLGSQLALADTTLPSGTVTGGVLASPGPVSGTASVD